MKVIVAAVALATLLAGTAEANTYNLGTLTSGATKSSNTVVYHNTTGSAQSYTDVFDFTLSGVSNEFTSGAFTESPSLKYLITGVDLSLFDSSNTLIATTGLFDPATGPSLTVTGLGLAAGDYHVTSTITVPKGDFGSYTLAATAVSAAPEPASWALMLVGVGGAGAMLRRRKAAGLQFGGVASA